MSISPRSPETLNHTYLFDEGVVRTWLKETTNKLISIFAMEDTQKLAEEQRRAFKLPTPDLRYGDFTFLSEKFGAKAEEEAKRILEIERKAYVEFKSPYIKNVLEQVIKRLRNLVYAVDEKGKAFKLQIIIEKVPSESVGQTREREVTYVLDHDYERLNQIGLMRGRTSEFNDYVPFFNQELHELWETASSLGSLEYVRKEEKKDAET